MRIDFPDGSFMLSWQHVRAWYDSEGNLKDCEKKYFYKGCPAARAIPEKHKHVRAWLSKRGKDMADLLNSGILKRKV